MERRGLIPDFLRGRFGERRGIDKQAKMQIASFQDKIRGDIADLFVNPNMESRTLNLPVLDWKEHLPDTLKDNAHFRESKMRWMILARDNMGQISLSFDFERVGSINYSFDDKSGNCRTATTYYQERETIRFNDRAKDPVSEMLRLSRMSEALGYFKAELAYREANGVNANQDN